MKKFRKKPFRDWLDTLAKIFVKTDDNFTCQIQKHDCGHIDCKGCSGVMQPLSYDCQWCHIKRKKSNHRRWDWNNIITGCAHCHSWGHDNEDEFQVWFQKEYPQRYEAIREVPVSFPWKEENYKAVEKMLLEECLQVGVDYMNVPVKYRMRLKRKLEELKG